MENLNSEPFELIERQFKILDRQRGGSIKSVRGRGVVGKHPIITNDMPFKVRIEYQIFNKEIVRHFRTRATVIRSVTL